MMDKRFAVNVIPGSHTSATVIAVQGALVLEHLFKFQDAWRGIESGALIFDLSGVQYIDSAAVGSLVNAHVSCSKKQRRLALAGVTKRAFQILEATRVHSLFSFYPDSASAQEALSGSAASA